MKKKLLVFALYAALIAGICIFQYYRYSDSFAEPFIYEHSFTIMEPSEAISLDLNHASAAQLAALPNVSRLLADEIVAYRREIGGFTQFQQLLEVPGMQEQLYLALGEYLYLTPAETAASESASPIIETTEPAVIFLNLNTASVEELCLLPGIGEATASAIAAYRSEIGEYVNKQQLLEVAGIGKKTLADIADYLYIENEQPLPTESETIVFEEATEAPEIDDAAAIPETTAAPEIPVIDLNLATREELLLLPKCDAILAENVLALRETLHGFQNILQVLWAEGMTEEIYLSWEPYLAVDHDGNTQIEEPVSE